MHPLERVVHLCQVQLLVGKDFVVTFLRPGLGAWGLGVIEEEVPPAEGKGGCSLNRKSPPPPPPSSAGSQPKPRALLGGEGGAPLRPESVWERCFWRSWAPGCQGESVNRVLNRPV